MCWGGRRMLHKKEMKHIQSDRLKSEKSFFLLNSLVCGAIAYLCIRSHTIIEILMNLISKLLQFGCFAPVFAAGFCGLRFAAVQVSPRFWCVSDSLMPVSGELLLLFSAGLGGSGFSVLSLLADRVCLCRFRL
ncbi:transmembrane protein, putative [Medicago truncatula]|uniref:Transmembrane protein, putative n=1 Tax=Medicago truncatula TaxID=3880 RepID=A0A072U3X6_MEDTR|nr:transmembrane protein, putative [Medicago truncatula]